MNESLVFRHHAMATHFEVRFHSAEKQYGSEASLAIFAVCDRLEELLSRYRETSDISRVNNLADGETARLSRDAFRCLGLAEEFHQLTRGAFDPGLGAWTLPGTEPPPGRGQIVLDSASCRVKRVGGPVSLDLGAIGKGYALDRMAEELLEWEIGPALLSAGGSSLLAVGAPQVPDAPESFAGWEIGLEIGGNRRRVFLKDGAVGSSGSTVQGEHILDPADGVPRMRYARTWAFDSSAAAADALSTAWMNLSPEEITEICRQRPGTGAVIGLAERPELVTIALPEGIRWDS
jgi:thiamine biosynthesis lipoprotein